MVSWKTKESVASVIDDKHKRANHHANIANAVEYVQNADPEHFAHIRDEVFEVLEEVNFEEIDSDEEILSDDADYTSDLSERDTDYVERFVPSSEIRALNNRTKHYIIHCYYTTSALSICAECMIRLTNTDIAGLYLVRKHDIGYIYALSGQSCTNCRLPIRYIIMQQVPTVHTLKKLLRIVSENIVSETLHQEICGKTIM